MSIFTRALDPIPALKRQVANVLVEWLHDYPSEIAGLRLGLARQRVGDIRHGRLDDFSLQRLVRCLYRLGGAIEITIISDSAVAAREYRARTAEARALVQADRERRRQLAAKRRLARERARNRARDLARDDRD